MNQKATKQKIFSGELPPLLNMAENRPVVDSTFRNWEENNTPFINTMMSPLYEHANDSVIVYDKQGNEYTIEDNYLKRNSENVAFIQPQMFIRENITDDIGHYYDYTEDDTVKLGSLFENNELSFEWTEAGTMHTISIGELFSSGSVQESRLVLRNYNNAKVGIWVAFTWESGYPKVHFIIFNASGVIRHLTDQPRYYNGEDYVENRSSWTTPIYRTSTDGTFDWNDYEEDSVINNVDPVINIGTTENGYIAFSILSSYGKSQPTLNYSENGFLTYLYDPDNASGYYLQRLGARLYYASVGQTTGVQTGEYANSFRQQYKLSSAQYTGMALYDSNAEKFYKYEEEGVVGEETTFPLTYTPTDTGNTVEIDGVTYKIYSYRCTKYTYSISVLAQSNVVGTWQAKLYDENGTLIASSGDIASKQWTYDIDEYIFTGQTAYVPYDVTKTEIIWTVDGMIPGESSVTVLSEFNRWVAVTRHYETTVTVSPMVLPCYVLDNGLWYSIVPVPYQNTAYITFPNGGVIVDSARASYSFDGTHGLLSFTPVETSSFTGSVGAIRAASVTVGQNLFQSVVRLYTASGVSPASAANGTAETNSYFFAEYSNSNANDKRWFVGSSTDTTYNYYSSRYASSSSGGSTNDALPYVVQGFRVPVLGTVSSNFKMLFNESFGNIFATTGISWASNDDNMGTLVTPWFSIDEDFYISGGTNSVVYRDVSGSFYRIRVQNGNEIKALLDDRYILVNTTSYYNLYDSVTRRMLHYASDYNGRCLNGNDWQSVLSGGVATTSGSANTYHTRTTASAINGAYKIQPRIATGSMILPAITRIRCKVGDEKVYASNIPESSTQAQGIDIYYSEKDNSASVPYRCTLIPFANPTKYTKYDLDGSTYETTTASAIFVNTNIFSKILNGAGNNDMVEETSENYTLVYYNTYPYFLYNVASASSNVSTNTITGSSSTTTTQGTSDYFVIQGQFYGVINDKLYSLIYDSGAISSMDAIIDVRGFKFVGNNPMIAFFWSPSLRSFYSFTGDANLTHIYNGNKFSEIGEYWYDESTQSIFIDTNRGLLVFGPKNTYILKDYTDVTNVQFTDDGLTHITSNGITYDISYYPRDNFTSKHLLGETSFFGLDNTESTSIDRWNITIYDPTESDPTGEIKVGVRSLTDVTVKSEEKVFKVTPDMWDKWSHSILLAYNPKLIKGQGIRLTVDSPWNVTSIVPHIMDNATGTLTRRQM